MFGFSLTKLLFTAAVIALIWYGFKWVGRVQTRREAEERARLREGKSPAADSRAGASAHDMVKCAVCGDFVSPEATRGCDRPNCPYPA
jgi:uncharacterized protein